MCFFMCICVLFMKVEGRIRSIEMTRLSLHFVVFFSRYWHSFVALFLISFWFQPLIVSIVFCNQMVWEYFEHGTTTTLIHASFASSSFLSSSWASPPSLNTELHCRCIGDRNLLELGSI